MGQASLQQAEARANKRFSATLGRSAKDAIIGGGGLMAMGMKTRSRSMMVGSGSEDCVGIIVMVLGGPSRLGSSRLG